MKLSHSVGNQSAIGDVERLHHGNARLLPITLPLEEVKTRETHEKCEICFATQFQPLLITSTMNAT